MVAQSASQPVTRETLGNWLSAGWPPRAARTCG